VNAQTSLETHGLRIQVVWAFSYVKQKLLNIRNLMKSLSHVVLVKRPSMRLLLKAFGLKKLTQKVFHQVDGCCTSQTLLEPHTAQITGFCLFINKKRYNFLLLHHEPFSIANLWLLGKFIGMKKKIWKAIQNLFCFLKWSQSDKRYLISK